MPAFKESQSNQYAYDTIWQPLWGRSESTSHIFTCIPTALLSISSFKRTTQSAESYFAKSKLFKRCRKSRKSMPSYINKKKRRNDCRTKEMDSMYRSSSLERDSMKSETKTITLDGKFTITEELITWTLMASLCSKAARWATNSSFKCSNRSGMSPKAFPSIKSLKFQRSSTIQKRHLWELPHIQTLQTNKCNCILNWSCCICYD